MHNEKSVLFLCQFFYPETVSSATLPYDTAVALSKAGFNVGALCGYPKEYLSTSNQVPTEETVNGIRIKRLKYKTCSRKTVLGRLMNFFSFTLKCLLNIRHIKNYSYLIVYSNPPILPYVAYKAHKKYGTKIVFVSYDVYPEIAIQSGAIGQNSFVAKAMRWINAKLYPSLNKAVTLSDEMKTFLAENRNMPESKIVSIPNWYHDSREFVPPKRGEQFVVSYFGNMGTCQDIDTLLGAALLLKDDPTVKFVFGGHGNKVDSVFEFAQKNNLENIEIKPFLTGQDYETAMLESDCFLLSLLPRITNLCYPSKLYSYLSFGRPVIAVMDACELTKMLTDHSVGFTVPNGNASKLAETIDSLKSMDDASYAAYCQSGYRLYKEKYDRKIALDKYISLLSESSIAAS